MSRYFRLLAWLDAGASILIITSTLQAYGSAPAGIGTVQMESVQKDWGVKGSFHDDEDLAQKDATKSGIESEDLPSIRFAPIPCVFEQKENPQVSRSGSIVILEGFEEHQENDNPKEISRLSDNIAITEGFEEHQETDKPKEMSRLSGDIAIIEGFEEHQESNKPKEMSRSSSHVAIVKGFEAHQESNTAKEVSRSSGALAILEGFDAHQESNKPKEITRSGSKILITRGFEAHEESGKPKEISRKSNSVAIIQGFEAHQENDKLKEVSRPSGDIAILEGFEEHQATEKPIEVSRPRSNILIVDGFEEHHENGQLKEVSRRSGNVAIVEGFEELADSPQDKKEVSRQSDDLFFISGFEGIAESPEVSREISWKSQDLVFIDGFKEKINGITQGVKWDNEIAQADQNEQFDQESDIAIQDSTSKTTIINFNNVGINEYVRFVSRITGKSFLFDDKDLNFNVTVISEEPTSADNVMTTLIQTLRIHGLLIKEQGDHYIIYRAADPSLGRLARVVSEDVPGSVPLDSLVITQVFKLNTLSAANAAIILQPALSPNAIIGTVPETNQIVVTDIVSNLQQASQLLRSIDSPASGLVVGQYVLKNPTSLDKVIELSDKIMLPISQGQPYSIIPHPAAGSIFVVGSPFIVEKAISIMQHIDQNQAATKILDLQDLKLTKGTNFGWQLDSNGNWIFRSKFPLLFAGKKAPPPGHWVINKKGEWEYIPEETLKTPAGEWKKGQNGNWYFIPKEEEEVPGAPQGEWKQARDGTWYFIPTQTKMEQAPPKSSLLPREPVTPQGKWKRDVDGTWFYVPEGGPSAAPPEGQWKRGQDGTWYFIPQTAVSPEEAPLGIWQTTPFGTFYYRPPSEAGGFGAVGKDPFSDMIAPGQWVKSVKGRWIFELEKGLAPSYGASVGALPTGEKEELLLEYGGVPEGEWIFDENGIWVFKLAPGQKHIIDRLIWESMPGELLGYKKEEKVKFYLHKIRYQDADKVHGTLLEIGASMQEAGNFDSEFISVINGAKIMTATNGLIFTGTEKNLEKVRELVDQIDIPIRQVFIEMLILDTTLADSLSYGVNFGARFGGGDWSGAEGFNTGAIPLPPALATAGVSNGAPLIPSAAQLANTSGFNLGIIGQHITHGGLQFNSLGTLITAIHDNNTTNVVSNPKILVENNSSASIFVGLNTAFKTQSISNDQGSVLTNNFEYRDVGTRLDVKASISNNDIITLDIEQEVSKVIGQNTTSSGAENAPQPIGPTTSINRTKTRVHIPDGYFLIISGMISDEIDRTRNEVPCLGGVPILGSAFSFKNTTDDKRNLMIFLRPKIVESGEEIDETTRRQQDIYKDKIRFRWRNLWDQEVEEAFDYMNLKDTDPEAIPCDSCKLPCFQ